MVRHYSEDKLRTHINFIQLDGQNNFKKCPSAVNKKQTLTFRIERDDSNHKSIIKYRRTDTNKNEQFTFNDGSADHTNLVYDGQNLTCNKDVAIDLESYCNDLPVGIPVPAIIYEIDFNPRDGKTINGEWSRNKYTISTEYYASVTKCRGKQSNELTHKFIGE